MVHYWGLRSAYRRRQSQSGRMIPGLGLGAVVVRDTSLSVAAGKGTEGVSVQLARTMDDNGDNAGQTLPLHPSPRSSGRSPRSGSRAMRRANRETGRGASRDCGPAPPVTSSSRPARSNQSDKGCSSTTSSCSPVSGSMRSSFRTTIPSVRLEKGSVHFQAKGGYHCFASGVEVYLIRARL